MHSHSNTTGSSSSADARHARYRTDTGETSLDSLYTGSSTTSGSTSLLSPADPNVPGVQFPWSPPVPAVISAGPSPSSAAAQYGGHAQGWSIMTPAIATAAAAGSSAATSTAPSPQDTPAGEAKRVPRPPNAWILYRSDCIQKMRAEMPEGARKPTQADLSKQFGEQWRNESEEVKTSYERLAEAAREEHAQKHPDWKFCRKQAKPNAGKAANARKAATPAAEPAPKRTRPGPYVVPGSWSSQKPHSDDMITTLPPMPAAELPRYYVEGSSELPHQGQQIHYQDRHSPIPPQHQYQPQQQSQPYAVFPVQHMGQYPQQQTHLQAARPQQVSPQPLYTVPPMPVAQSSSAQYTFPAAHAGPPKQQQGYAAHQRRPSIRHNIEPRLYTGEGLHDTLARRSSSAVELFNVYNRRQVRGPAQSGLQPSVPEDDQTGIAQQEGGQAHFDSNSSDFSNNRQTQPQQQTLHPQKQMQVSQYPQDQALQHPYSAPTYHTTTKVLPFDSQVRSLPAFMPFGMPSSASPQLGVSPQQQQQQAEGSISQRSVPSSFQQLDLSQFTWLQPHVTSPSGSSANEPSAPGTTLPDWLLPFGQVRVRQDDVVGTPLLDFLTGLSASANAHAAEAYVQESMLPSPTGLVAENIEETTYSPPKESGGPSYSFP